MSSRISILTGNHLCHNPRVIKEASALAELGYRVEVLGAWFDHDLKRNDKALLNQISFDFRPVVDLTIDSRFRMIGRAKSKIGKLAHQVLRLENNWQLGPSAPALKKAADESNADLFIAHSEAGMYAAAHAFRSGKQFGIDLEDWFSEDLLPKARAHRPNKLLHALEGKLLRSSRYKTCTSRAMAEALATEYRCEPPAVIYNAFPWSDRDKLDGILKDRRNPRVPSINWYSQTLGFRRGLEELVSALPFVQFESELHLRGKLAAGFREWLARALPGTWGSRVFIHDLVSSDELPSRIAEHDIGFAGEVPYCRNRQLTVSNKILQYLVGGLAVVASDTTGQKEIAIEAKDAVSLYKAGNPQSLAAALNGLLGSKERLSAARAAALKAARETFSWERQVPKLQSAIEFALSTTS